jgi:hypothetical protein
MIKTKWFSKIAILTPQWDRNGVPSSEGPLYITCTISTQGYSMTNKILSQFSLFPRPGGNPVDMCVLKMIMASKTNISIS